MITLDMLEIMEEHLKTCKHFKKVSQTQRRGFLIVTNDDTVFRITMQRMNYKVPEQTESEEEE